MKMSNKKTWIVTEDFLDAVLQANTNLDVKQAFADHLSTYNPGVDYPEDSPTRAPVELQAELPRRDSLDA
jgi:hypothetical protein